MLETTNWSTYSYCDPDKSILFSGHWGPVPLPCLSTRQDDDDANLETSQRR